MASVTCYLTRKRQIFACLEEETGVGTHEEEEERLLSPQGCCEQDYFAQHAPLLLEVVQRNLPLSEQQEKPFRWILPSKCACFCA